MSLLDEIGRELGKDRVPFAHVGDTVKVHYLIKEGDKERVQIFAGIVLAIHGRGIARSILVRRIVQGEGVERTFPLHGPRVREIEITRRGKVRQARLFYLRDRMGKQTRVGELLGEKVRREREERAREDAEIEARAREEASVPVDSDEPESVEV
jgi:large subunit ribosomal protein L19